MWGTRFCVEQTPKTRQVQKLLPEADNELALETLLPGFGHDLSLHLGNSLFQIFRLKVGCPDQKRYRVQGSYDEDTMCSMHTMHGVWGMVRPLLTVLPRDMMGYACCRGPLPQNLEIISEFQTMLHVLTSCLKCSLNLKIAQTSTIPKQFPMWRFKNRPRSSTMFQ